MHTELRLRQNPNGPGFVWAIVLVEPPEDEDELPTDHEVTSGQNFDMTKAAEEGCNALLNELRKPGGPVRHEFDCSCGGFLAIEARRSRQSPYSWDSPREITCKCGRVYGVKLQFAAGLAQPRIEAIYRTTINVAPPT